MSASLTIHDSAARCEQPPLEGAQRPRAAESAPVEVVAEAGLEVVGVVDHRAPACEPRERRGGDRPVGDHAPALPGSAASRAAALGQLGETPRANPSGTPASRAAP